MAESEDPIVAVTMGDPAGIGAEVVAKAHARHEDARALVVGDAPVMRGTVERYGIECGVRAIDRVAAAAFETDVIDVLDVGAIEESVPEYGTVKAAYGAASLAYVDRAIDLVLAGTADAMTTAPINKRATERAGSEFAGHTARLADRTGTSEYSMMLVAEDLRVTHVSTHVPLREACERLTTDAVETCIELTDEALYGLGLEDPRIAVAGLNPHASDGGVIGSEEAELIRPAVERAREAGIDAVGPESPDAVYRDAARGAADCVVSMYHDQGHIPIKMLDLRAEGGHGSVNYTIGLPIVRTSVDHGTAFDIAGEGVADPGSLQAAVALAARVASTGR